MRKSSWWVFWLVASVPAAPAGAVQGYGLFDDGLAEPGTHRGATPEGFLNPLGLSGYGAGGLLERRLELTSLPLSSALDYRFRPRWADAARRGSQHALHIGPRFSVGADSDTHIYYRYAREEFMDPGGHGSRSESSSVGAGIAQTWQLPGHRQGELRVEYGIEGPVDSLTGRWEEESLNVSGVLPLWWGLDARFGADYTRPLSPRIGGDPVRRGFSAGLTSSLGERFRAGLSYRYEDQRGELEELAETHHRFGLNIQLTY